MRNKSTPTLLSALIGLGTVLTGCSQQTLDSARRDAQHDATAVDRQAQQAERQARPQLASSEMQVRVTAALAAANLPATIHVRADADGVYLRGTVYSMMTKVLASQITRSTIGPGKAIHNEIHASHP